jgi:hypothetical protein
MSDAAVAARWQFAFTIMFHYIFPILTMGLGALIALLGTQYKRLSGLARRLRLPRIPRGSGYDRHAPA